MNRGRARFTGCSAIALLAALAGAEPALAQATKADSPTSLEEVVVTGSRIAAPGTTPTPVTVVTEEDIAKLGLTNTAQIIAQLPQNSSFISPATSARSSINLGLSVANLRGLNPYRGTRTLTLVDTRRHVPTSNSGAVDLNVVPSLLIQRVETVTGGASAAYGSDAVAGVINLILDTKLEGFKAQVDYGVSGQSDGDETHASVAGGMSFADGRGHIVAGAEYQLSEEVTGCAENRDWCRDAYGVFTNAGFATNGQPRYVIGPNARSFNSVNGMFPLVGLQFNSAGTALVPFTPGAFANPFLSSVQMQGGADANQSWYARMPLRPEVERYGLFTHVEYDFSDSLTAYAELSYSQRAAENRMASSGASIFTSAIRTDNAYLPASARPLVAAFGGAMPFASNNTALPYRIVKSEAEVARALVGLKGDFTPKWSWDVYYTYGQNKNEDRQPYTKVVSFFNFALDAVDNPATPAFDPVCRATLPGPGFNPAAAGCRPLNMFGANNFDPAAVDYAFRTQHQDETYTQHVASATVRGELFEGWGAGPINFAAGAEFRHESIKNTHDLRNQPWYFSYEANLGNDFSGTLDVLEGFAEVRLPLLLDAPFAKALVVDGAVRQTNNTNKDKRNGKERTIEFTTWKLSGVWDVNDWLRLRATRSRDVRVAGFFEQYGQMIAFGGPFSTPTNPWAGGAPQPVFGVQGGAGPNLDAEKADTTTVGIVLNGKGPLSGAFASADWYEIELNGPISTLGGVQNAVNACFLQRVFCDQLQGTGPVPGGGFTTLTSVNVPFNNLGKYTTRGVDLELGYKLDLGNSDSLTFRLTGAYLYDLIIDYGTGAPVRNNAGISGPNAAFGYFNTSPKWQANAVATYSNDRFTGTLQARYVGPGKLKLLNDFTGRPYIAPGDAGYSTTHPDSISSNDVDSRVYFNVSGSVRLFTDKPDIEIFGSINNLLDTDPPVAPDPNGFNYPTNPVYFDTIGRYFRLGARMRY